MATTVARPIAAETGSPRNMNRTNSPISSAEITGRNVPGSARPAGRLAPVERGEDALGEDHDQQRAADRDRRAEGRVGDAEPGGAERPLQLDQRPALDRDQREHDRRDRVAG